MWGLLILRFGYRFGTGDQVELLPYTLFLNNPQLYPHDFFIQGLHTAIPNERTVMAHLLVPFVNHLEIFCFLFQMLSTVVLITGLEKLAMRFISNKYLVWSSIFVALIPLNDFGLGNVEVYSECLQASGVACAIVVWGLNIFLDRKYLLVSVTMAVATFIQVLDGLDVMLVLSAIALVGFVRKKLSWKEILQLLLPYSFTAGVWLLLILQAKSGAGELSSEQAFDILFEFRHPHHFIFATFSKLKIVVYSLLTIAALLFFCKKSKPLFEVVIVANVGLLFYVIATDCFHLEMVANFQFYKVTQWVKFLGVIAIAGFLVDYLPRVSFTTFTERVVLIVGLLLCFVAIYFFRESLPYSVPCQIGKLKEEDDAITIAQKVRVLTPTDAVFVQPFENTELKFYGERSSYVEFKANVRHKAFVGEWYRRIQEVYCLEHNGKTKGFELQQKANEHFKSLTEYELEKLKGEGVTHMLVHRKYPPAIGKLVTANNTYAVYQL